MIAQPIKQFGVNFGDNDFRTMYEAMLPVVARSVLYNEITDPTHIAKIVSEASYGFYRAVQNPFIYNHSEDSKRGRQHLDEYFAVYSDKIFVNDDLLNYISEQQRFHNGELFCVTVDDPPYFWSV
jgi:hypothetical protein